MITVITSALAMTFVTHLCNGTASEERTEDKTTGTGHRVCALVQKHSSELHCLHLSATLLPVAAQATSTQICHTFSFPKTIHSMSCWICWLLIQKTERSEEHTS